MQLSALPRFRRYTLAAIPEGREGTRATLKAMARMVADAKKRPIIRENAVSLVSSCLGKDYRCELQLIFEFVRDRIRYIRDVADVETVQWPEVTLQNGGGDCDDKVVLAASLLQAIGHPVRMVALRFDPNREFSHVILESRIGPQWVGLELTEDWPMGMVPPYTERMEMYP